MTTLPTAGPASSATAETAPEEPAPVPAEPTPPMSLFEKLLHGVHLGGNERSAWDEALFQLQTALDGEHPAPAAKEIVQECIKLALMLLGKNTAYGNSALEPLEVFAKDVDAVTRMAIRMDDKISRIARGSAAGEDPEADLAGYLILRKIAQDQVKAAS